MEGGEGFTLVFRSVNRHTQCEFCRHISGKFFKKESNNDNDDCDDNVNDNYNCSGGGDNDDDDSIIIINKMIATTMIMVNGDAGDFDNYDKTHIDIRTRM